MSERVRRWSRGDPCLDVEPPLHIQVERTIRADMRPDERHQAALVRCGHAPAPTLLSKDALEHQGVDVHQAGLEEMQRRDRCLLLVKQVRCDLAASAEKDEAVGRVPRSRRLSAPQSLRCHISGQWCDCYSIADRCNTVSYPRGSMKSVFQIFAATVLFATASNLAHASETRNFGYDALGRLVSAVSTGDVNNGQATTYCLDSAGNRTRLISNTSGAPAVCASTPSCVLAAANVETSDEFSIYPWVGKSGSCTQDITLAYTIQIVSGSGNYTDGGFYGGNIFSVSDTYKGVWIYPTYQSVPANQSLVLLVTFSTTTPGVTFSPATSYVTIASSY